MALSQLHDVALVCLKRPVVEAEESIVKWEVVTIRDFQVSQGWKH